MSLCKLAPLWWVTCVVVGTTIGHFVLQNTIAGLSWGVIVGSIPIWPLLFAAIWHSLATSENPRIVALPLWIRPVIPLVFLGVPWLAALGLQLLFAERIDMFMRHPGMTRLVLAIIILPVWWMVVFRPDWNARRRMLLVWTLLLMQGVGVAVIYPIAEFLAGLAGKDHLEWLVCVLMLALLPALVYVAAAVWLFIARNFASRKELKEVAQVQWKFDCWLFDKIVGRG